MPGFNVPCSHKYLVVTMAEFGKTDSFKTACKIALKGDNSAIYERLGKNDGADWYILATNCNGHIVSEVLGDLPTD